MLTYIHGARCIGIKAIPVTVEVDIASGIGIHLVGLADLAVKESLLRTVSALQFMGYRIPGKKIVINLAPADIKKKGSGYDVPIAIGIIAASGQEYLPEAGRYVMMGELGLDGSIRKVPGALPIVDAASELGFKGCILPEESAMEAVELGQIPVYGVKGLADVIRIVSGLECNDLLVRRKISADKCRKDGNITNFADIIGQEGAKRGLEIAAAGGHNVIMIGAPGSGKSTLAKALPGILPPMDIREAIQTSKIYSVAGRGNPDGGLIWERPFRAPHLSSSLSAIIGGGSDYILPGEISLAHNGVLFLDEFLEAPKKVTEALRGPLEDRKVIISRLKTKVEYPSSFMLVAATNPCPCGYYGEKDKCTCTPARRQAYLSRLSGPMMDRIDIHLWLHPAEPSKLVSRPQAEPSKAIAERTAAARKIQKERFAAEGIFCNAEMTIRQTGKYCRLDRECQAFLKKMIGSMGFSARACSKILKIARTIADLDGSETISVPHLSEASGYRFLDKRDIFV